MRTRTTIALMLASLLSFGAAVASAEEPVKLATCKDGKTQYVPAERTKRPDKGHMGACRGHGGVASWADGSPVRAKGAAGSTYR